MCNYLLIKKHTLKVLIFSNRVEAWTRDVDFLLQQEGRPVAKLIGNKTYIRVMQKDWKITEEAANWIKNKATKLSQPFALYLGLNLPHPYPSPSSGENYGASTFLTSPYWLQKVCIYMVLGNCAASVQMKSETLARTCSLYIKIFYIK